MCANCLVSTTAVADGIDWNCALWRFSNTWTEIFDRAEIFEESVTGSCFPYLPPLRMHLKDYKEQFISLMDSCGSIGTRPTLRPQSRSQMRKSRTIRLHHGSLIL